MILSWVFRLPHKRGLETRQRRLIRRIVMKEGFHDCELAETVALTARARLIELLSQKYESVCMDVVTNIEKGEVIVSARGDGSFQLLPRVPRIKWQGWPVRHEPNGHAAEEPEPVLVEVFQPKIRCCSVCGVKVSHACKTGLCRGCNNRAQAKRRKIEKSSSP